MDCTNKGSLADAVQGLIQVVLGIAFWTTMSFFGVKIFNFNGEAVGLEESHHGEGPDKLLVAKQLTFPRCGDAAFKDWV